MSIPEKRYRIDRIIDSQINGELVNNAALIWFRDPESFNVILDAFADQYGYYDTMTMPEGQVPVFANKSKEDFFIDILNQFLRKVVLDYRKSQAELESVVREELQLP